MYADDQSFQPTNSRNIQQLHCLCMFLPLFVQGKLIAHVLRDEERRKPASKRPETKTKDQNFATLSLLIDT